MGTTPQQTRTLGPASPAPVSSGPSASSTAGGVGNVSRIQAQAMRAQRSPGLGNGAAQDMMRTGGEGDGGRTTTGGAGGTGAGGGSCPADPDATGTGQTWEQSGNLIGAPPVRTRLRPPNNAVIEDQSVYAGRRASAEAALATQRQRVAPGGPLLDREGNVTDFRYWFAKVYSFVTENELRFTDRRAYYYPGYVMASVAYFEQIYADNYAALDAQGPVEEHWRAAFEEGARQQQLQENLAEMMLHPSDPEAVGGVAMAYLTQSVLGAVSTLTASMKAHIRYDLPRAEAWVFNTYYASMPGVALGNFQPDFMAMTGVFDRAAEQMNAEMAERLHLPVDLIPRMIQDGSMATLFDADMATERADTWQRAEALVQGGNAGNGPYQISSTGRVSGNVTWADNLGPIGQISPNLRPSMDSSAPMIDDDDSRSVAARSSDQELSRLSATEKTRRVRGLIRGVTFDDDELTIQRILNATLISGDTVMVVNGANAWDLVQAVDGSEYRTLRTFLQENYYARSEGETAFTLIRRCLDGETAEWEEEMVADILVARFCSDGRTLIERLGEHYGGSATGADAAFRNGLNKLEWQLDGADETRVTTSYGASGQWW